MAILAGIDMSMVPQDLEFPVLLKELVEEGQISESRIDLSVRRILSVKEKLGLLEEGGSELPPALTEDERQALAGPAARAALECITLLKNEGTHAGTLISLCCIGGHRYDFRVGTHCQLIECLEWRLVGHVAGQNPKYNNPEIDRRGGIARRIWGQSHCI